MDGTYEVRMGDKAVGQASLRREGLYYHISCRCTLPGKEMYRLILGCGSKREDLGVCVPMEGQFGVDKKIPCKRLREGTPEFRLRPKIDQMDAPGKFIPVYPEEPFAYIRRLEKAYLACQDGQLGVMIPEQGG